MASAGTGMSSGAVEWDGRKGRIVEWDVGLFHPIHGIVQPGCFAWVALTSAAHYPAPPYVLPIFSHDSSLL